MPETSNKDDAAINQQNISYYDEIAGDYDAILQKDETNTVIRSIVAEKFITLVKGGCVLDFGGGTGQDLEWLVKHNYAIVFCEPSNGMRQIAIERSQKKFPGASIFFLDDDKTHFRNWSTAVPFAPQADAILANFAVINCIPDIELLFKNLALTINPGGIILAIILNNSITGKLRSNLKGTIRSFFTGDPVTIKIDHKGQQQLVYIHSTNAIKKASAIYFEFKQIERLHRSAFSLIHLVRK